MRKRLLSLCALMLWGAAGAGLAGQGTVSQRASSSVAQGQTQFPAPNDKNWSPLGVPMMPPSYYTVPAPGFHSPAPSPPPVRPNPPAIIYYYPPSLDYDRSSAAREEPYLFYCPDYRQYYPQVTNCPSPWLKVLAGGGSPAY